jgi:hypothetical protein
MGIFGRRKIKRMDERVFNPPAGFERIRPPIQPTQPAHVVQYPNSLQPFQTQPTPMTHEPQQDDAKGEKSEGQTPAFAPLFIKLTKYKQILGSMNYIKTNINLVRNQLAILNELERLRTENMKMLQATIEKLNERLINLDSQFMRPSGFMEDMPEMHMQEVESLGSTIADLNTQIEGLKQEMDSLA